MTDLADDFQGLLDRLRAGDRDALAELFARHREPLRRMIELRLDRRLKGRVSASDVLQEAYVDAMKRVPHFFENPDHLAERMLRAQAIGRRNWTFLGSDRGGRTAAVLSSLTGTCKHHDIDPFVYLQDLLSRLPSIPPG